jgi:hypothetical protein
LIHVLGDDSGKNFSTYSLVNDVVLKLSVEKSLDINEPFDKIVLIFKVFRELDVNGTKEGLKYSEHEF